MDGILRGDERASRVMAYQVSGNAQFESVMGPVVLSALLMLGGAVTAGAAGQNQRQSAVSSGQSEASARSLAADDYNKFVTEDKEGAAQNLSLLKGMRLGAGSSAYAMMKRSGAGEKELGAFRDAYVKELGEWTPTAVKGQASSMSPEECESEALRIAEKTLSDPNISAVKDSKEIRSAAILGAYAGLARKGGGKVYVSGSLHTSSQIDAERKTLIKEASAKYGKEGAGMAEQAYSASASEAK